MNSPESTQGDRRDFHNLPIHKEWSVPSNTENIKIYSDKYTDILENVSGKWWNDDDLFGFKLAFDEAITNAMKYGNNWDDSKNTEVIIDVDENKIEVAIWDTNNPNRFDPESAFESVEDESQLLAAHGRGIFFMNQFYTDGVKYEFMNPGNKVTMTKLRVS